MLLCFSLCLFFGSCHCALVEEPASILSAHKFEYLYTLMRSPWASSSPGWTAPAFSVSSHGRGVAVHLILFMVLRWTLSCSSVPLLLGSSVLQVCLHQGWAESCEITSQMQFCMLEMESKHHLIAADDVNCLNFVLWNSFVDVTVLGSWPQEFPSKVLYGTFCICSGWKSSCSFVAWLLRKGAESVYLWFLKSFRALLKSHSACLG